MSTLYSGSLSGGSDQEKSDSSQSMSAETVTVLTRLYGCIGLTCLFFGLLLNGLAFNYFYRRRRTLSNTVYCGIVTMDLLISTLMLPYILPHFSKSRDPFLFSSPTFCKFWTVTWGASSKSTIVLVAVLGTLRTVALLRPLTTTIGALKRRLLLVALLYWSVLVSCETVPMWRGENWYFHRARMKCEWEAVSECDQKCDRVVSFGYLWNSVTHAVPVLPMLVNCAVLSLYGLKRCEGRVRNRVSMTILIFTVISMVLNTPTLIYWIMAEVHHSSGYSTTSLLNFDQPYYFYSNFVEILLVALNSLFKPMLFIWRIKELRNYLLSQFYNGPFKSCDHSPIGCQYSEQNTHFTSNGIEMQQLWPIRSNSSEDVNIQVRLT